MPTLSKSAIILEQIINDAPLSSMKRQEAYAHLQSIENARNELEGKVSEMESKIDSFQGKLDEYKSQQDQKSKLK